MSTVAPSVQTRNGHPRDWGNYASLSVLPNASAWAGGSLASTPLEQGDTAFVIGTGSVVCMTAGTPGLLDAVWAVAASAVAISPLDIPTNGIFYGRADATNTLSGGRVASVADLFGTGRVLIQDGAGSAPLFQSGGGPGSDSWLFVRTTRQDRLRIVYDAGMAGVAWSAFVVQLPQSPSFSSLLAKTTGTAPRPFDFGQAGQILPYLAGEAQGFAAPGWRADAFSREGTSLPLSVWSRGSVVGDAVGTSYANDAVDILLGNRQALDNGFDGRVAAVAIWNRALTAAEMVGLAEWARREWLL